MREYELAVVFDLSLAEADGQEAGPNVISTLVEARKGSVVKVDHWGRRRMAYPIKGMLDADYVISRVMLEPEQVRELETALKLNERVLRHLVVRADELPVPRQREEPPMPAPAAVVAGAPVAGADAPAAAAAPEDAPEAVAAEAAEPIVADTPAAPTEDAPAAVVTEAPVAAAEEAVADVPTVAEAEAAAEVTDAPAVAAVEEAAEAVSDAADETPEGEKSTTA